MRILMTADAVGGVWTYALELARALLAFGVETTIATMGPAPSIEQRAEALDVPRLDLLTRTFALEWMEDPWRDLDAAGEWLLDVESDVRPAVVHLNGYAHAALPWSHPVVVAGHSCVASWQQAVGEPIDVAWMRRYRSVVVSGLRAADWVVAPSAAMLQALQRLYGPLGNASVIANGRDPDRFLPREKEPLIFAAGRLWDRAKNIDTVAAIAPDLSWPVAIAGGPEICGVGAELAPPSADGGTGLAPASARLAAEQPRPLHRGRTSPVYLGKMSSREIASWLGRASIFVLPARYEPFGLLPLEAALAGCALVLGDIASLREIWSDAALYVDPDDRDALPVRIERLIAEPRLLVDRAAAARSRALTYTSARMAERYARLYGALVHGCQHTGSQHHGARVFTASGGSAESLALRAQAS
jgi:glycogen synthase